MAVCSTVVPMASSGGGSNSAVKTATTTSYSTTTGTSTSTTTNTGTATGFSAGTSAATTTGTTTATRLGTTTDTVTISIADIVEISVAVTVTSTGTGTGTSSSLKGNCVVPGLNFCFDYNYSLSGIAASYTFSATNHYYYYSLAASGSGKMTCNHASGTQTWGVTSATITPDTTTATQQSSCVSQRGIYGPEPNCSADMSDGHCTYVMNGSGNFSSITFTNVATWAVP